MKTYQTKSVVVEAVQWTGKNLKSMTEFVGDRGFIGSQSINEGLLIVASGAEMRQVQSGQFVSLNEDGLTVSIHNEDSLEEVVNFIKDEPVKEKPVKEETPAEPVK
jgi:hypothetical protein